ncbi:MAG: putative histidine kinase, classic [Pedosphaera sp.]|nr:putative histidine kinase, classic [Pedosphaera sp.]
MELQHCAETEPPLNPSKNVKVNRWGLHGQPAGDRNSQISKGARWIVGRWLKSKRLVRHSDVEAIERGKPSWVARYGLALMAAGTALCADLLLKSFLNYTSAGLFLLAAIASTWYGGGWPGVMVVVAAALCNLAFYHDPHFSLAIGIAGWERLASFSLVSLLIIWLTACMKQAKDALVKLNSELEQRVAARTAALEESNKHLESFSYTLAHDLRAPLRAMQGFSHFLLDSNGSRMDQAGRDYAERIRSSSERMGQLIMDLLAYMELSRTDSRLEKIAPEHILAKVVRSCDDEIRNFHASIEVESPLPPMQGDPAIVERVLFDLLSNALKFRRLEVPPRIRFRGEERGRVIRLWVEDNGMGIDRQYQDRVFGVFEKLDGPQIRPGTGIGLALVKTGVERMGGRVGVESTLGEGSRFWFELPKP